MTRNVSVGANTYSACQHGTLYLLADGSKPYPSVTEIKTAAIPILFVYTIKDGDGDLSTTTLTINLANATILAPGSEERRVGKACKCRWLASLNQDIREITCLHPMK